MSFSEVDDYLSNRALEIIPSVEDALVSGCHLKRVALAKHFADRAAEVEVGVFTSAFLPVSHDWKRLSPPWRLLETSSQNLLSSIVYQWQLAAIYRHWATIL